MNQFHRIITSFDHQRVIRELTQAGALFQDPVAQATEIMRNNERHVNIGHFDFRKSPYLLQWVHERGLRPDRMGAFVSMPVRTPTVWHRDGPLPMCAINIPWFGTSGTFTEWCPDAGLTERVITRPDGSVQRIEGHGPSTPSERVELHNKCIALNVSAFHRVFPEYANGIRGILSLRFPNGYHYAQLVETLSRYDDR